VVVIDIDYGNFDVAARAKVTQKLEGLEIGVLVSGS
jgi:hypothetical protein